MRAFGIIPAAGHSVRMGRPKLLLPWDGTTVIQTVLREWLASRVDRVVLVIRSNDAALAAACDEQAQSAAGRLVVVRPELDPPDMKASVAAALDWLARHEHPMPDDAWLFAPADLPTLRRESIDGLLAAATATPGQVWAPEQGGKRGHPALFPWSLAPEVARLAPDEGLNRLLDLHPIRLLADATSESLADLDTPDDYARLTARMVERRDAR